MFETLKKQPSVQKLVTQYDNLPRRDQMALQIMAVAIALFLVYFLIWRPVAVFHENAVAERQSAADLVAWMQQHREDIAQLGAAGESRGAASQITDVRSLMSTVTTSANESGLSLQRFEPSGEDGMRVWIEDAPFNQVSRWLETLTGEYGIVIDQAAIDRENQPGLVSVRLSLEI
ncbi:type II secretion system protein GspM [Marinobacter sp. JSM 1782161]|uniref:type II secretion system protein GspM n=1 Tax=Marinobacter sp. JSM 1782161 TaxID=2685906 RepID=UPI001402545A|nr:type II secretion system protein M [Marinobacter sp. JSM 1782161]